MSSIRGYNKNAIVPVPADAHIIAKNNQVYINDKATYVPDKHYYTYTRVFIGLSVGDGKMYPNQNYALRWPDEYKKASGEDFVCQEVSIGMYAASLGIITHNGLYEDMMNCLGPENTNAMLDFADYSILFHSNAALNYPDSMKNQFLFSDSLWSDSRWSEFINDDVSSDRIQMFKKAWIQRCRDRGITRCWLSIDGSNYECTAEGVDLKETTGQNKIKNSSRPVVGYMYVVSSADGTPITYEEYRGGRVDSKEIKKMIDMLRGYDIETEGVILDRGFADAKTIEALESAGLDYVIMLEAGSTGTKGMTEEYGEEIRMSYDHYFGSRGMYGIVKWHTVFRHPYLERYVALIYDSVNGTERVNHFYEDIRKLEMKIAQQIKDGKKPDDPGRYLRIEYDGENHPASVSRESELIKSEADRKGFSAMVLSKEMKAAEAYEIYRLRQGVEKLYASAKTQLGYYTGRNYYENGTKTKKCIEFMAIIIRNEIEKAAHRIGLETNPAIRELNFLHISALFDNKYVYSHTENKKQTALLKEFGVNVRHLEKIAEEAEDRKTKKNINPVHKLPEAETQNTVKRGRGRPKGSKNMKTLAKEAAEQHKQQPQKN